MPPGKRDTTTPAAALAAQERRKKALDLRLAGASYRRIAQEGIYSNPGTAMREVKKALAAVTQEAASDVLKMELERLDAAMMGIWAAVRSGDVFAIDRMLKIMDMRARFLGLYGAETEDNTENVKSALTDFFAEAVATADAMDAAELEAATEATNRLIAGEVVE